MSDNKTGNSMNEGGDKEKTDEEPVES